MQFGILGPLQLMGADGPVAIRGVRRQLLLANLLLNVGQVVPVVRLIDALWPDDPPHSAVENIRTYICDLRAELKLHGGRARLDTYSQAYRLQTEPDELDLLRFDALAAAGEDALRLGDHATAARLLGNALALWRDVPLSGLEVTGAMQAKVIALQERQRLVVWKSLKARMALGEHEDLVPMLREMVAEQPLDEGLWCALATTLHALGRTGEALRACADARTALLEELGLDPGPDLNRVQLSILNGEKPAGALGTSGATVSHDVPIPWQVPAAEPGFVGRGQDLEQIQTLIEDSATRPAARVTFVALHGPPGFGKTATALAAAAQARPAFPDGQLYAQLGGSTDEPLSPSDVLGALLAGLGVGAEGLPSTLERRQSLYRSLIADRRMLVVLDDVAGPEQIAPLIAGDRSVVLATSRRCLAELPADARIAIGPLSRSQSLDILSGIVGADRVEAEPKASATIADACRRMPLAVRIAGLRLAARPTHRLQLLADRLTRASDLDEFSFSALTVRDRYESSYHSLDAGGRRCVRALADLGGDAVAVADVAALLGITTLAADRLLEDLVHRGVLISGAGDGDDGSVTYLVPGLLRAFARELVADEPAPPLERRSVASREVGAALSRLATPAAATTSL